VICVEPVLPPSVAEMLVTPGDPGYLAAQIGGDGSTAIHAEVAQRGELLRDARSQEQPGRSHCNALQRIDRDGQSRTPGTLQTRQILEIALEVQRGTTGRRGEGDDAGIANQIRIGSSGDGGFSCAITASRSTIDIRSSTANDCSALIG